MAQYFYFLLFTMQEFFEKVEECFPDYNCTLHGITIIFKPQGQNNFILFDLTTRLKNFFDSNVSPKTHCTLVCNYRARDKYDFNMLSQGYAYNCFMDNVAIADFNKDFILGEFANEIQLLQPERRFDGVTSVEIDFYNDDDDMSDSDYE